MVLLVGWGLAGPAVTLRAQDATVETEPAQNAPSETSDAAASTEEVADTQEAGTEEADAKVYQGQNDLDEAIINRIDAKSARQLDAVTALLESSIEKGLDDENEAFARKMLGSVLLQRAQELMKAFPEAGNRRPVMSRRQAAIRGEALRLLNEAVVYDSSLVDAYLLVSRLNLMPGGDREQSLDAVGKAIELLEDNPVDQAGAYLLRALIVEDLDDKMADLNEALKVDPGNKQAIQLRAGIHLENGDVEAAVTDLEKVLLEDPTNQAVAGTLIDKLVELDRISEAIELVTKLLAAQPSEGMYRIRAVLHRATDELDKAMADLDKAIAMAPKDPQTLLQRALLALQRDDIKSAKADFRAAVDVLPILAQADQGIEMRMQIAIAEKRTVDAINDAKLLVDRNPRNVFNRVRLATLYTMDERPRQAIEVLSEVLREEPENVSVLRSRGDARLSVGDHSGAIEDYEQAITEVGDVKLSESSEREIEEASGLYNNLAWVLATSPNDSVRNGKRALELAEKSATLTEFKAPHILSTLAAAYAEKGDFEKARQWSEKAVQLAAEEDYEQLEQLQNELKNYQDDKAWREKQETEENDVPILDPSDLIDT